MIANSMRATRWPFIAAAACLSMLSMPASAQRRVPRDLSGIRGFNYQSAPTVGHTEHSLDIALKRRNATWISPGTSTEPDARVRAARGVGQGQGQGFAETWFTFCEPPTSAASARRV